MIYKKRKRKVERGSLMGEMGLALNVGCGYRVARFKHERGKLKRPNLTRTPPHQ